MKRTIPPLLNVETTEIVRTVRARGRSESGRANRKHYEKTRSSNRVRKDKEPIPQLERRMIAWDGEGIKLSGPKNPQHYVLFGCSAEPDNPLTITDPIQRLKFEELVDYACDIALKYPGAIHVGYFFGYDQNMIAQSLTPMKKRRLYEKGRVSVMAADKTIRRMRYTPGKQTTLTRITPDGKSVSLTIDDIAPFFAKSFVKAYEELFPVKDQHPNWRMVIDGKLNRADTKYWDMAEITRYWEVEIVTLEQLAVRFREIMYEAGFELKKWYGPGALANYIRQKYGLIPHEWGGKEEVLKQYWPEVHKATKQAYFGGRFEQFKCGRIPGPVYAYDINSAYPSAFVNAPSLREGGEWKHVLRPSKGGDRLGVYRLSFVSPEAKEGNYTASRPMPLPYRDGRGNTSYPTMVRGWYWFPETYVAAKYYGARIVEGWEWVPADSSERPWHCFEEMYAIRLGLKAKGSPIQMPFKLGPNSMYGKMAQRAGWDQDKRIPPRSHTLPLAGWITSYCRATIMEAVARMDPDKIIAIETDGIYTTEKLDFLDEGKQLGQWEASVYDEMIYIQSGVYLYRVGDEWKTKTRGMGAKTFNHEMVLAYLRSLQPGDDKWEPVEIPQGETFIGLGSAISRSKTSNGGLIEPKLYNLHCRWIPQTKKMGPGREGKRYHIAEKCPACENGDSPAFRPHQLFIRSFASMDPDSYPYRLPWERDYYPEEWREDDERAFHEYHRDGETVPTMRE